MKYAIKVVMADASFVTYAPSDANVLRVKAVAKSTYKLVNTNTGFAPDLVRVKRAGSDLMITISEGNQPTQEMVIEGYFESAENELAGLAENGSVYSYVPLLDDPALALASLNGEQTVAYVLGESAVSAGAAAAVFVLNPLLAAAGVGGVAAAAAAAGGGDAAAPGSQQPDATDPVIAQAPTGVAVSADGTRVTGKGQPGAVVTVKDPEGNVIGATTVDADGNFNVALNPAQKNGETVSVTARGADGESVSVTAQAPDITPAAAPTGVLVNADGTQVSGKGEPGSTVTVKAANGAVIGTATVGADGNFAVALSPAQKDGETLSVTSKDVGGESAPVTAMAPDNTPAVTPTGVAVSADGAQVTGKGQPGSTVTVKDPAGNVIGAATVGTNGNFTLALSPARKNGETLSVTAKDAGGESAPVMAKAPDVNGPAAPTGVAVSDDGTQVTGKTDPNTDVVIKDADGNVIASGTSDANGDFAVELDPALEDGETVQVTATDDGGENTTTATAPDTTPATAPSGVTVNPDGSQLTGKGEPGSVVTVKDPNGNVIGSATVGADGNFAVPLNPAQKDGETLSVTAKDAGGESAPVTATAPDTTPATAPSGVAVSADGAQLSGKGEPGAVVTVKDPEGNVIGSATVGTDGNFAVALNPAQKDGETLSVTAKDAGGESAPVTATAPDTTPATAPSGVAVSADGAQVSGKGEPGAVVTVKDPSGTVIGSATVGADGNFAVALNPAQKDGETLSLTAKDAGGESAPVTATAPDTTPATAPSGVAVSADGAQVSGKGEPGAVVTVKDPEGNVIGSATVGTDGNFAVALSPAQKDGETLSVTAKDAGGESAPVTATAPDTTPAAAPSGVTVNPDGSQLSGKGEPGAVVTVKDPEGNVIGSATVGTDGNFAVALSPAQKDGETLSVTAKDAGGESAPVTATAPDTTPATAPSGVTVNPDGSQVSGKGEPGSVVTVKDPSGNVIGSSTVGADGNFAVGLNPAQKDGETLSVTAKDVGGESAPVNATAPDTTPAAAPTGLGVNATGTQLTGKGEPGSVVTVKDPNGNVIGSATVGTDGNFAVALNPAQKDGETLSVTAKDAGGESAPVTATAPDTTPATAPSGVAVSADGAQVSGKGEPGAVVTVKDPEGNVIGSATVGTDGNFAVALNPAQKDGETLSVTAKDAGGESAPVTATAPDTTPATAPSGVTVNPDGNQVSGKGEPGAVVTVKDPSGTVIGSATVGADGNFAVALNPAQKDGETLSVTAKDAGGESAPVTATAPDTTPATAPSGVTVNPDGSQVSGKGEPGSVVTVKDPNGTVIGSATVGADGNFAVPLNPAQNDEQQLSVTAKDAGGESTPVNATAPDTTPATAPTDLVANTNGTQLTGKGEPDSIVTVKDPNGTVIGSAIVGADGNFAVPLSPALRGGSTLGVTARDPGGESASVPALIPHSPVPDSTTIGGGQANAGLGYSLNNIGDFNGDGIDDFIVSAPHSQYGNTAVDRSDVYIVYGTRQGLPSLTNIDQMTAAQGIRMIDIDTGADGIAGLTVTGIGDMNGDGLADVAVFSNLGTNYVLWGRSDQSATINLKAIETAANRDGFVFTGGSAWLGDGVAGGDINGDGLSDLIIGDSANDYGRAHILYGRAGAWNTWGNITVTATGLTGATGPTNSFRSSGDLGWFGDRLNVVGDVNGDGYLDFVVNAPASDAGGFTDTGASYLIFGGAQSYGSGVIDMRTDYQRLGIRITGTEIHEFLGGVVYDRGDRQNGDAYYNQSQTVSTIGDFNGDGIADFIIGSPEWGDRASDGLALGRAYVFYGKANGWADMGAAQAATASNGFVITASGIGVDANLGFAVNGGGDFNGDGFGDFLISAVSADTNGFTDNGAAWLVFGRQGGYAGTVDLSTLVANGQAIRWTGNANGEFMGTNMAMGDWSGDGFADVAIPRWGATSSGQLRAGSFEVYYGNSAGTLKNGAMVGPVVVDLNRDGVIDYSQLVMDVNSDGVADQTAWVDASDGVLVWDKFGDGVVHDHSQYAFTLYGGDTDLDGLRIGFDSNNDGVFDANDALFHQFAVWQDVNQNGISDAGEVMTLEHLGLVSMALVSDGVVNRPADGVTEFGTAFAQMADGEAMHVADVSFAYTSAAQGIDEMAVHTVI